MKSKELVFLLISLSITAGASLLPQGGDQKAAEKKPDGPLAENVFKNIQTLKGTPAGEVVPAMKFMCASLKVDCNYCHADRDFASDEKQPKKAARHMIEMQREINTKNFAGRNQVTCNTCHNGSPSPQGTPIVLGASRSSTKLDGAPVEVADVLKKYTDAVGSGLKSVTLEGTFKSEGQARSLKLTQATPNKFVMESPGHRLGFDGSTTWADRNKLSGLDAVQIQHFGRFLRGEHAFDGFGELRYAGRDKVNAKDVVVLRTFGQGAVSEDLYFDERSGMLLRIASYTTTILGRIPEITDFENYRKVGGSMVPFKVSVSGSLTMEFTKATPNPTLSDGFFSMPGALYLGAKGNGNHLTTTG